MEINNISQVGVNSLISASRAQLMGVFIIVIMLFHNSFGAIGYYASLPFGIYGHWGVDAFLFLSGFGLFFSLKKSEQSGVLPFYRRRLVRIMPAAVLAGSILYVCGAADWLGLLGLNLWYIRTTLILYLLSPFIYKSMIKWNATLVLMLFTLTGVVGVLVAVPVLAHSGFIWETLIVWTLSRLPAFVLGMYIAKMDFSIKQILNPAYILLVLVCLASALYIHFERNVYNPIPIEVRFLAYVPVAFLMPLCLVLLARLIPIKLGGVMTIVGSYSLELYLVHEAIFRKIDGLSNGNYTKFLLAYGLSAMAAWGLSYCCARLGRFLRW